PISFLEMGYDSLFLTQVAQKIQSQMKVKITFRQLLAQYSTIPTLAAFLADKVPATAVPARAAAPATLSSAPAAAGFGAQGLPVGLPVPAAPFAGAGTAPMFAAPGFAGAAPNGAAGWNPVAAAQAGANVSGLEALFRDQLNSMSQLIARQFDVL